MIIKEIDSGCPFLTPSMGLFGEGREEGVEETDHTNQDPGSYLSGTGQLG